MNLIVAVDRNWGIGKDGGLLCNIPGDMKFFKKMTTGNVVFMGRKTLESFPTKKGLPNRTNYVLTSNKDFEAERCIIVNDEAELFEELSKYDGDEVFLIGGASMYNKYYDRCDTLYITKIDAEFEADSYITNIDEDERYEVVSVSDEQEENGIKYRFYTYKKRK